MRHLFNFGPRFADGIMDVNPPDFSGPVNAGTFGRMRNVYFVSFLTQ